MNRILRAAVVLAVSLADWSTSSSRAVDYWLADGQAFPGAIWHARDGGAERLLLRREPTANPAFPRAIMKVAQVAAARDGAFYFCSGLDGSVLGLLDQRHEVLTFEVDGQVRDLACGGEEHVVYYSIVPTPQNGEPLADGKIYRRDVWAGAPAEVATIRQADVGGAWWGTFTVREGVIYLATTEPRSRIWRLSGTTLEPIAACDRQVNGLEADGERFLVADDEGRILETRDFGVWTPVRSGAARFSDVTVRRP